MLGGSVQGSEPLHNMKVNLMPDNPNPSETCKKLESSETPMQKPPGSLLPRPKDRCESLAAIVWKVGIYSGKICNDLLKIFQARSRNMGRVAHQLKKDYPLEFTGAIAASAFVLGIALRLRRLAHYEQYSSSKSPT
jgi:hypothetical protein